MRTQEQQRRKEITALLEHYRKSGLTRAAFCEQAGIAVSTLDYYRRQETKQNRQQQTQIAQALLEVRVKEPSRRQEETETIHDGFSLTLPNGHRIEASWKFEEDALAKLIRIVEGSR